MATIKDVANLANVSTATVSRVLTGRNRVEDITKQKVLKAMEELNYRPNILGKQLRELQTNNILVVIPDFNNAFYYDVLQGIEIKAMELGYEILLKHLKNKDKSSLDYFNYLQQKQVDGIILLSIGEEEKLRDLGDGRLILASALLKGSEIPNVAIDNETSAYKMTNHLIQLGHQKIAFISGGLNTISSIDRLSGYKKALKDAGIEIKENFIQEGDYFFTSGLKATEKLMDLSIKPTAIFAASDQMAAGAMKSIQARGLSIPKDISVVGFDNTELSFMLNPELTTVSQPSFQIGEIAMEMMNKQLIGDIIEEKQIILEGNLVIRESCGKV